METQKDQFYIGWQPEAPDNFASAIRMTVMAAVIVISILGVLLVLNQAGFSSSTFEYGVSTQVEGVLTTSPAPFVRSYRGQDVNGVAIYQHLMLVGPGKQGIREILESEQAQLGSSLEGKMVRATGYLIYHDGKTLMEVEDLEVIRKQGLPLTAIPSRQMEASLIGEITDPKCFFGVMKPGHGKPHRSCAARCIAGGIPPVLKTLSSDGSVSYYIITGEDGKPINTEVLPFVGDQVALCGEIRRMGEWMILYKSSTKDIRLLTDEAGADLAMCK